MWGEIDHSLKYEMNVGLDDAFIRRTHIFSLDPEEGLRIYETVADRMADILGWSQEEKKKQIERYFH